MIYQELLNEKKKKLQSAMPEITDVLFEEYFISGNRLKYEDVYFARRSYLTVFGILPEENEQDAQKLEQILTDICGERTWALPPHINRDIPGWEHTLDLFAAETAFALAEIIVKKADALTDAVIETVKQNVMQRVLVPFMQAKENELWWERTHMNWCAVCNSCIGAAGVYLLDDGPQKDRFIERIIDNMTEYLQAFPSDGACLEGMDYFYYAMGHLMLFWEVLEKQTEHRTNWEQLDHIQNIFLFPQKCILRGGYTVSFSDSSQQGMLRVGVQGMMHERNKKVFVPGERYADFYADPCYRYGLVSRDVIYEQKQLSSSALCEKQEKHFFEKAQWLILNHENRSLVVKGGNNDEPHNHNDVGSFIWIADDTIVLADLGAGEYTQKYFDDNTRYEYLCCRSAGHNVPTIDGREQTYGKEYFADSFAEIENGVCMELQSAYPRDCGLKMLRRKVYVENTHLIVEDDAELDHIFTCEENFISQLKCEIKNEKIILYGKDHIYEMELILCGNSKARIEPYIKQEVFNDHKGEQTMASRFGFTIICEEKHLQVKVQVGHKNIIQDT